MASMHEFTSLMIRFGSFGAWLADLVPDWIVAQWAQTTDAARVQKDPAGVRAGIGPARALGVAGTTHRGRRAAVASCAVVEAL